MRRINKSPVEKMCDGLLYWVFKHVAEVSFFFFYENRYKHNMGIDHFSLGSLKCVCTTEICRISELNHFNLFLFCSSFNNEGIILNWIVSYLLLIFIGFAVPLLAELTWLIEIVSNTDDYRILTLLEYETFLSRDEIAFSQMIRV